MTARIERAFHPALRKVGATPDRFLPMYSSQGDLETAYVAFLESIETGSGVPDGCDKAVLRSYRWATRDPAGWRLTDEGRQHLRRWRGQAPGRNVHR